MCDSLYVTKQSAKSTTRGCPASRAAARRDPNQRNSDRENDGSARSGARPSNRFMTARTGANRFTALANRGAIDAALFSGRTRPKKRADHAGPPARFRCPANSALSFAMSTLLGHSFLHALQPRHRSRVFSVSGSSHAAEPSPPFFIAASTAVLMAFARPRGLCRSSSVARYEGHIVPAAVLRQKPAPLHVSSAPPKPPCVG